MFLCKGLRGTLLAQTIFRPHALGKLEVYEAELNAWGVTVYMKATTIAVAACA